jgi:hypothetical protein
MALATPLLSVRGPFGLNHRAAPASSGDEAISFSHKTAAMSRGFGELG